MIGTSVRAVVSLAREMAEIVPAPPGGRRPDPVLYRAWEGLMMTAASGLAESVKYDELVLSAAVGPEIEVGVNPPWRVLLLLAQLEAEAHNGCPNDARPLPIRWLERELPSSSSSSSSAFG